MFSQSPPLPVEVITPCTISHLLSGPITGHLSCHIGSNINLASQTLVALKLKTSFLRTYKTTIVR